MVHRSTMLPSFNPDCIMMCLVVWFVYALTKEDYFILQLFLAGLIVEDTKDIEYRGCKATLYSLTWDWDRLTIEES